MDVDPCLDVCGHLYLYVGEYGSVCGLAVRFRRGGVYEGGPDPVTLGTEGQSSGSQGVEEGTPTPHSFPISSHRRLR